MGYLFTVTFQNHFVGKMPALDVHSEAGFRLQKSALCLSLFVWLLPQQILGTYYVSLPRSFSPGYPLDIYVQVANASSPVLVEASIVDVGQSAPVSRTINTVHTGHPQQMQLTVPSGLRSSRYKIYVTGTGGLTFHDEANLHYEEDILILIQTDKSRYSGGQPVKYRAIFLMPDLSHFPGNVSISIYDAKNNRIQEVGPVQSNDGVIEGQLNLSRAPVFGDWKIEARCLSLVKSKMFKVSDYNLPRFSVEVLLPPVIMDTDNVLPISVKSRFTFNADVYGNCTLYFHEGNSPSHFETSKEIRGIATFTVPMAQVRVYSWMSGLKLRVIVTDNATALSYAVEKDIIIQTPHLDVFEVKEIFKRRGFINGLNYTTFVKLTKNDKSPGMAGTLRFNVTYQDVALLKCMQAYPQYAYDYINKSQSYFSAQTHFGVNGVAEVSFPVHSTTEKIELTIGYDADLKLSSTLYPILEQQTTHMLQMQLSDAELEVGKVITISVATTQQFHGPVTMEVYSRNRMVAFDSKTIRHQSNLMMDLTLTEDMVPFSYIVVSHVTNDGYIWSDSAYVAVDGSPVKNKIDVRHNSTSFAKPGDYVSINITTDPYSTVYMIVGDERNRLLGTENEILPNEVTDGIASFTHSPAENTNIYNLQQHKKRTVDQSQEYGPLKEQIAGLITLSDGVMVTPNLTSQFRNLPTSCNEWNPAQHEFPTWIPGMVPTPAPGVTYVPNKIPTPAAGMTYAPQRVPGSVPGTTQASAPIIRHIGQLVRSKFPETWIWEKHSVGPSGELQINKQLPDSITSWITSAFATNAMTGFGIAENIPKLTVKNEFFITMDLPDFIVMGEEFLLQVTVFNYLPTRQQVFLSIQHSDDLQQPIPSATVVQPGEGHSTFVKLTPQSIGDIVVTAMAKAGDFFAIVASDTLQKTITVRPPGVRKTDNQQHLIHLHPAFPSFSKTVSLVKPLNIVPGTDTFVTMEITGDFMVPSINGLQNLLKLPHGCGEQNMVDFAPDVYIYKYLRTVGKLTSEIEKNTRGHLEFGYQNELVNKHSDGSFSAFGMSDNSGSSWLTAFVLKCFGQARSLIMIDDNVLKEAMVWLLAKQNQNGSFHEPGTPMRWVDQSVAGSGTPLNSFIMISLLENRDFKLVEDSKLTTAIMLGVGNLERQLNVVHDAYTMAIMCYSLALAKSSQSNACLNKLKAAVVVDGDKTYWTRGGRVRRSGPLSTSAAAQDIETTAYALLAYIEMHMVTEAFPIVKWLVSQRNPTGGFKSTQDTVVALQALSKFSEVFGLDPHNTPNYGVNLRAVGSGFSHQYAVTVDNFDMTHSLEVPSTMSLLDISATGFGLAVIDVAMTYYVQGAMSDNFIQVNVRITKETTNSITINTCLSWTGNTASNMLLADIEMPTGFVHDTELLNAQAPIKRYERNGRNLALYFDALTAGANVCVWVTMDRFDPVAKSQACHVVAYDYYEPTNQAIAVYESGILKKATICEVCPLCGWCHSQQFQPSLVGK